MYEQNFQIKDIESLAGQVYICMKQCEADHLILGLLGL